MKTISPTPTSVEEFRKVAGQNTLLWCLIYDDENPPQEELINKLHSLTDDEFMALLMINSSNDGWIMNVMNATERPVLLPYCGGWGIDEIYSSDDFDEKAPFAIHTGMQMSKLLQKRDDLNPT